MAAAGYVPGLYVEYAPGLDGHQLYENLNFQHYWAAYNVDGVSTPYPRGWQLVQSPGKAAVGGLAAGEYDVNTTSVDGEGGSVVWLQPTMAGALSTLEKMAAAVTSQPLGPKWVWRSDACSWTGGSSTC